MSAKKMLMIIGDYAEDYEVMVPYQAGRTRTPDKAAGRRRHTRGQPAQGIPQAHVFIRLVGYFPLDDEQIEV
jgi:hypothetical protein